MRAVYLPLPSPPAQLARGNVTLTDLAEITPVRVQRRSAMRVQSDYYREKIQLRLIKRLIVAAISDLRSVRPMITWHCSFFFFLFFIYLQEMRICERTHAYATSQSRWNLVPAFPSHLISSRMFLSYISFIFHSTVA
jgi:hypothetical protein